MKCGISSYICLKFLLRRACTVTCFKGYSQVKMFFGPAYAKMRSPWATPKTKNNFFWRNNKNIINFQKHFVLSKYMFWLSCECFSILCDVLLLKSVIYNHNSCVVFIVYSQYLCKNSREASDMFKKGTLTL